MAAKLAALGHSGQALGQLFVKLSSQGVHFGRLLLTLVCACTHLETSTCRSVSALLRSWVNSINTRCRESCAALISDMRWACIGELMSQRVTISGRCCQVFCRAGQPRSRLWISSSCFWHCSSQNSTLSRHGRSGIIQRVSHAFHVATGTFLSNHWNTSLEN